MNDLIKLTNYSTASGWGAKLGPGVLNKALCGLTQPKYENLLVDYNHAEDAGIYKVSDDIALVQTVDFFPPIVDDPFTFGQIAAANSLSDVYAMGGKPITAMSIVGFPEKKLDISYLKAIFDGGMDKLREAETALVGGHSVNDEELKYGLSVTGIVHPDRIRLNNTPKLGDKIILTKAIGTGIINTALKGGFASDDAIKVATKVMIELNKKAADLSMNYSISACTDVTGFGFLGHLCEMIDKSALGVALDYKSINILPEVTEYVEYGMIPAGTYRNKNYRKIRLKILTMFPKMF